MSTASGSVAEPTIAGRTAAQLAELVTKEAYATVVATAVQQGYNPTAEERAALQAGATAGAVAMCSKLIKLGRVQLDGHLPRPGKN